MNCQSYFLWKLSALQRICRYAGQLRLPQLQTGPSVCFSMNYTCSLLNFSLMGYLSWNSWQWVIINKHFLILYSKRVYICKSNGLCHENCTVEHAVTLNLDEPAAQSDLSCCSQYVKVHCRAKTLTLHSYAGWYESLMVACTPGDSSNIIEAGIILHSLIAFSYFVIL